MNGRVEGDALNSGFEGEMDGGPAPDESCGASGEDEGKLCGGSFLLSEVGLKSSGAKVG